MLLDINARRDNAGEEETHSVSLKLLITLILQVDLGMLLSVRVAVDPVQGLAGAAYSTKHNFQVCQPNAAPCYPCAMGTANTALRTSGSVNHDVLAACTNPARK